MNRYNCGSLIKPIPVVPYIKPRPPSNVVVPYIKPRPPSVKRKPRKRKRRRSTKSPKIWIRIIREKTVEKKRKK